MRIVENRQTIGPHVQHPIQRLGKAFSRLEWQTVDQVDTDRAESTALGRIQHSEGLFFGLDTIDGLLNPLIEILHAQTHAVESDITKQPDGLCRRLARVDLD